MRANWNGSRQAPGMAGAPRAPRPAPDFRRIPMRALVVDDSRAMRAVIGDVLRQAKFQVLEAGGVREAVRSLEELGPADLAMVDWNLPKTGGMPFVKAVRARPEFDSMRLMMLITELDASQVMEGVRAGVDECLVKPFTRSLLLEKLARLQFTRATDEGPARREMFGCE